uniref:BTB domain-containing protein n=1 Tax=Glossina brevipalpis TaxID=37001 RepID=A0A1A9WI93_9MUSC
MVSGNVNKVNEQIVEKKIKHESYGNKFLNSLNEMRIAGMYCDVSLDVRGELLYVHGIVISICSPYLAAILENDTEEKTIKLENVDVLTVKKLIEYMYSGTIVITGDNVRALLRVSNLFQIQYVKERCEEFLERNVIFTNSFQGGRFSG